MPDKRRRLVDAILESEEFVDYWAYKWSDLLLVSSRDLGNRAMWSYYRWVRDSVAKNTPWDRFVRQVLTSTGNSRVKGELNYYQLHRNTIELAENVTQAFLGLRITCARCHNHPLEKWTQKDYYQFANLVSRVAQKNGTGEGDVVVYRSPSGDINHPKLGKPLPPRPLDGEELALDSSKDRRQHLAEWLTSAENPYFARAVVNKIWANFLGRGIVDPVDDMRATNPASNEKLLTALTKDFVEHNFDVKHLVRRIMLSATYQRSSKSNATNADDEVYYSRYIVRRLPAEVVLDAVSQVTRVPTRFSGYPEGTHAIQLPDTQVNSFFLTVFGAAATCQCRRRRARTCPDHQAGAPRHQRRHAQQHAARRRGGDRDVPQVGTLEREDSRSSLLVGFEPLPDQAGEEMPWCASSTEAEQATGADPLERDPRRKPLEDLMWAMLTGKEFLFNH